MSEKCEHDGCPATAEFHCIFGSPGKGVHAMALCGAHRARLAQAGWDQIETCSLTGLSFNTLLDVLMNDPVKT